MRNEETFENENIIDENAIQEIKEIGKSTGTDLFREISDIFLSRTEQTLNTINEAISAADRVKLSRAAHALKGSAGHVGAREMAKICQRLENYGDKGGKADSSLSSEEHREAFLMFSQLQEVFGKTKTALGNFL